MNKENRKQKNYKLKNREQKIEKKFKKIENIN